MSSHTGIGTRTWEKTVKGAISGPQWLDVRFWTFSRRSTKHGYLDNPKPLMCNRRILAKRGLFRHFLEDSDALPRVTIDSGPPSTILRIRKDAYQYADSDSDLDDESIHEVEDSDDEHEDVSVHDDDDKEQPGGGNGAEKSTERECIANTSTEHQVKPYVNVKINRNSTVDAQSSTADGLLQDGAEIMHTTFVSTTDLHDLRTAIDEHQDVNRVYDESGILEIVVEDAASITMQAILFYVITGTIVFRKYLSTDDSATRLQDVRQALECWEEPGIYPVCSSKSAYRLAVKYGYQTLKGKAFDGIQQALTPSNILYEYVTPFTAEHPEVQEMEMEYLLEHFDHRDVSKAWPIVMKNLSEGLYPHASGLMSELMKKLAPVPKIIPAKRPRPRSVEFPFPMSAPPSTAIRVRARQRAIDFNL